MSSKILINCGSSWPNGDYSWVDSETQTHFVKCSQHMPKTSYMMQIADYIKVDDIVWLTSGGISNQCALNNLKEYISEAGIRFFQDNKIIIFFGTASVTRLLLNDKVVFAHEDYHYDHNSVSEKYRVDSTFRSFQKQYLNFDYEIKKLSNDLLLLVTLFNYTNSRFFVYNCYESYKLNIPSQNFLFKDSNLLSKMLNKQNIQEDNSRVAIARKLLLLDQFSAHPSKQGNKLITKLIIEEIKKTL